jgi:transglutaminase-like putative cysteine protease
VGRRLACLDLGVAAGLAGAIALVRLRSHQRPLGGAPGEDYVVLATGRDYADVSPISGVIHGGANHRLQVAVTVMPRSRPR